jgi:arylsulfatase
MVSLIKIIMDKYIFVCIAVFCLMACQNKSPRPNIVLIMLDDVGISDIGCYGGEIATPNIDRLADNGLRFTTFYNMAKCNPTRSTMLTGLYKGGNGAVHLATLARQAGYLTMMSGKDHFDPWVPDYCRADKVFDLSFHFWIGNQFFLPPSGQFRTPYVLNGDSLAPEEIEHQIEPMYKTDFLTDYALSFINQKEKNQPFFLYLPYHAAHFPLQARPEDIAKYRGKYLEGWDKIREKRYSRMQELGILPEGATLSPPENNKHASRGPFISSYTDYTPWDSLSPESRDTLDLEMAVFAAMIDRADQNIGRIIDHLEKSGQLDNTLILFLVDNGSCPFYTNKIPDVLPGPADSYWSLRTSWANVGNTPYRQYKQFGLEGGSHTPFIAHWPDKIKPGTITKQIGHIVDIAPTFLDIMETNYPDSVHRYKTLPLHGESLLPILEGKERKEPEYFISGMPKFRMFRMGDFKIVKMNNGPWELYNMKEDPTELNNLAKQLPEKLEILKIEYIKVSEDLDL